MLKSHQIEQNVGDQALGQKTSTVTLPPSQKRSSNINKSSRGFLKLDEFGTYYPKSRKNKIGPCSTKIDAGELAFLYGPNGVGKSTFMMGLADRKRTFGKKQIETNGGYIDVAYICTREKIAAETNTVRQIIFAVAKSNTWASQYFASFEDQIECVIKKWKLNDIQRKNVHALSFGQRTRVMLAIAEIVNPFVLLLDEPSTGLDENGVNLLFQLLQERRKNKLISLVSTHDILLFSWKPSKIVTFKHDGSGGASISEKTPNSSSHEDMEMRKKFFESVKFVKNYLR